MASRHGPTPAEESRETTLSPSPTTQATTCSTRGRTKGSGGTTAPPGPKPAEESRASESTPSPTTQRTTCSTLGGAFINGVWKYDGTSWVYTSGGVSGCFALSLTYDSVDNLLFAGSYSLGVWKYDGTSWTNTGGGVSRNSIYSLAYDSGLLYAGTDWGRVWKYDGTSWTDTGGGVSGSEIHSLVYDAGHNLLYAGSGNGVWKYEGAGPRAPLSQLPSMSHRPGIL